MDTLTPGGQVAGMHSTFTPTTAHLRGDALLRVALKLDAAVTGANGAAYMAFAHVLDEPLGVSASFLRPVGIFLLAFAGFVYAVARKPEVSRRSATSIIALNALWTIASLAVLAADWLSPTTAGGIWIGLQAATVAGFAILQGVGLRR